MIDFQNSSIVRLREESTSKYADLIVPMLASGETVISCYQGIRDYVFFTSRRLITVGNQGFSGKKREFTSLPYNRIQAFSIETSGSLQDASGLELWIEGPGRIRLEFLGDTDVSAICRAISQITL